MKSVLICACDIHPAFVTTIDYKYNEKLREKSSSVIDFTSHSKSVWRSLNGKHIPSSGSRQYEMSFDVVSDISDSIQAVVRRSTPRAMASKQTRFNALECLRRIGKTICLSKRDTLGHEVHKQFQHDEDELSEAMVKVIDCMSIEERREVYSDWANDKGDLFGDTIWELADMAKGDMLFGGLSGIIDALEASSNGDDLGDEVDDESSDGNSIEGEEVDDIGADLDL